MKKLILSILIILMAAGCAKAPADDKNTTQTDEKPVATSAPKLYPPISNPLSRVTKKPFGIYITPQSSPVQPEKFKGYHTGVDFETADDEQNIDVPIFAACDGKLLLKKYATGYGGVAVQSCKLDGVDVTIIYGHLTLASISAEIGSAMKAGDKIGILGKAYSTETDGERKHLHFGIHKGTVINILGYVQTKSALSGWINAEEYMRN